MVIGNYTCLYTKISHTDSFGEVVVISNWDISLNAKKKCSNI